MISIEDMKTVRALLDDTPTNLEQDRAIANIFSVLMNLTGARLDDQKILTAKAAPVQPSTQQLKKFDELPAIEKIRDMERAYGYCNESWLQRWSLDNLLQIRRMWLASAWDFFPDQWTAWQVDDALTGREPRWDDDEKPIRY